MTLEAYDVQKAADIVVEKAQAAHKGLDTPPTTAWFLKKENLITLGKALVVACFALGGFVGTYELVNTIPSIPIINLLRGTVAPELSGFTLSAWVASKITGLNLKL